MVDLPEPLSPTSATVLPGSSTKFTAFAARSVLRFNPSRTRKSFVRLRTSSVPFTGDLRFAQSLLAHQSDWGRKKADAACRGAASFYKCSRHCQTPQFRLRA